MKVTKLEIRQRSSYEDYANTLTGTVLLEGTTGKQEVVLSPMTVSRIFAVLAEDLVARSKQNAALTKAAVEEAVHAPLLEQNSVIAIEGQV
jgi:H+/Cl- antiporter ClcA